MTLPRRPSQISEALEQPLRVSFRLRGVNRDKVDIRKMAGRFNRYPKPLTLPKTEESSAKAAGYGSQR